MRGIYDEQDRILSYGNAEYVYNAHGSLTTRISGLDTTRYTYDLMGNLLTVSMPNDDFIEYLIDAQNRRVGKILNGTIVKKWIYQDQLNPIAELDGNDSLLSRFVYGSKAHVPDYIVKGDTTYRVITDHLGSVRAVVNAATGDVVQGISYNEFGVVLQNTNPGFQPFAYAGGLYDAHTGLVRFGVRDYDANVGRWAAKDPIGFLGGDSNIYIYVLNDPINHLDLYGWDAIRIVYKGYQVDTGMGFRLPLGHAAVVAVDPNTGYTKYYEYGRYDKDKFGVVRRRTVPNLEMDCEGKPTSKSLKKLKDYISKNYGKGHEAAATYHDNADYQKVIDYAEKIKNDPNRAAYNILNNNCYTFSKNAIKQAIPKN